MRCAVVGAGSWGSAVSWLLGTKGHEVALWARDSALAATLNKTRHNPRYISSVELPSTVEATAEPTQALCGAELVVLATPSSAVRTVARMLAGQLAADTPLVVLSKGIEHETGKLILDVLGEELGAPGRLAVLSGPNHAEEVALGKVSATLIASECPKTAELFQEAFSTPYFRAYTSTDVTGVQLCGAAKNVIAIACGVAAELGYGDNTSAVLMTRGLAEISRLVTACGGQAQTCMGLAGMGDLVVTCTSLHSRNRSFGSALARHMELREYENKTHMVVEGALACRSIPVLADAHGVDVPISRCVRDLVWGHGSVESMISELMARPLIPEFQFDC
ncbi:MAG: NAD(P)-dependent glycerol-3-phosphate dehydrogenase [Coriobacteriales bacterium]|jgi:glycerol-3-phosphate dehydrogenase (NAD(P)+)|nr:NAD(P)-dependent glycerol-3-phosphate dehydrogenase [Coriobacteriales bacterium]